MEPVIIVSPEDLAALVKNAVEKALEARDRREEEASAQVFGLQGIADLFGVSKTTAFEYKRTFLAPAVKQVGQKIVTDVKEAKRLFAQRADKNSTL
nr:MAG TPA: Protein of unknown function (DUF3853) [Caudoviricetes sp.]